MVNIALYANKNEMVEVVKRLYKNNEEEELNKAIEAVKEDFDGVKKKNDKCFLCIEIDGFTVVSCFPELSIETNLGLINSFRADGLNRHTPLKLEDVNDIIKVFDGVEKSLNKISEDDIKKAVHALADAILDKGCLD